MRPLLLVSLGLTLACGQKRPEPAPSAESAPPDAATAPDALAPAALVPDAAPPAAIGPPPGELIVILQEGVDAPTAIGDAQCQVVAWAAPRIALLRCTPTDPALLEKARALPGVRSAEPNRKRTLR